MADVKIILQKGETPEQAEELIFKAFEAQRTGEMHKEEFNDPAMVDLINRMQMLHEAEYELMMQEIAQVIDEEHHNGNE